MKQTGLIWFNNDLRVHDNPALLEASLHCQRLICLFCFDSQWSRPTGLNARPLGEIRHQFLNQSLMDLSEQLARRGQSLIVVSGDPVAEISDLIRRFKVEALYRSDHVGVYENRQWQHLKADFPRLAFVSVSSHTLFRPEQLPFTLSALPDSFSRFRRQVEALDIDPPLMMPRQLPAPVEALTEASQGFAVASKEQNLFEGGEQAALAQLESYFSSDRPAHYKHWRNELDGWSNSTKFSPWLANGNLSVRRLLKRLRDFEQDQVANESTYWIYFELLWREYFQWVAKKLRHKLFSASGVGKQKKQCCFYPERYQKWCHGNTPYPLVNALMNQLNQTGYMSNRGRQIVASCLVNELQLDWRFGAAYFEQQLIDYDVGSNWGNWQYIAGVGMDPRGGRHFNIDKQTRQFDPEGRFIRDWQGEVTTPQLDSVDAADWPILPGKPTQ
jgi:deoxyribodipyrimidine photo-lyase